MDKETLSNYGWIVICTLVLAVMIALATPFGEYIKAGVWSTTNGLNDTLNKNVEIAGLSGGSDNNQRTIIRFGEKYIVTEHTDDDFIGTIFIFYEDGSCSRIYKGEISTLPAGSYTYTETEISLDGETLKILENGTKISLDYLVMTLESELPDGYAIFTDGTILSWDELKEEYGVTDTNIGGKYFESERNLVSIVIPDSITSIGHGAFMDCTSLTRVVIGNGMTTISSAAFHGCTSLKNIAFNGTIAQWNAISIESGNWNSSVPATQVICSDGVVTL